MSTFFSTPDNLPPLILASASPRRRALLASTGLPFHVHVEPVQESTDPTLKQEDLCRLNAELKAQAVFNIYPHCTVIGADTIVCVDDKILGKPGSLEQAKSMLRLLSGKRHIVRTGVQIFHPSGNAVKILCNTYVTFLELTDAVINEYVSKVHVLDKAGAYAIQEHSAMLVREFIGDYDSVMGLPLAPLLESLKRMGYRLN